MSSKALNPPIVACILPLPGKQNDRAMKHVEPSKWEIDLVGGFNPFEKY